MSNVIECLLCRNKVKVLYENYPGYKMGYFYSIFYCENCDTSFASPLKSDSNLYELIYSQIQIVPGFNRYLKYSAEVKTHTDSLEYLASSEDVYWSIQKFFQDFIIDKNDNILEIGSGLGYLTYSLSMKGYNVKGLDISKNAIEIATKQYGDLYVCGDIHELSEKEQGKYSVIIMTELIEHVENVHQFIASAKLLLKKGGYLILTTPNKSSYSKKVVWNTTAPPIHLWWFSETSIRYLAKYFDLSISFIDFSKYSSSYLRKPNIHKLNANHPFGHVLNSEGGVCPDATVLHTKGKIVNILRRFNVFERVQSIRKMFMEKDVAMAQRSAVLCAIMKKGEND